MADLWDPEGNPVNAPDDEGTLAALKEKGYRVASPEEIAAAQSGGLVNLVSPEYEASNAEGANLGKLLMSGYRLATQDELATGEIYNPTTPWAMARTAVEGLLSGATMGATNLAQRWASGIAGGYKDLVTGGETDLYDQAAADRTGAQIQAREAANPGISGTTNVAGAVGPAVVAALGAAATAPVTGTAAGVLAVAKMTPVAKLASLGTALAESMGATTAVKGLGRLGAALATGTAAGVEGAADTALNTVTQDMLDGKWDLTVERFSDAVLSSAGVSALLGGAVGAATFKKALPAALPDAPNPAPSTGLNPQLVRKSADEELATLYDKLDATSAIGDTEQAALVAARIDELSDIRDRAVSDSLLESAETVTSRAVPSDVTEAKTAWAKISGPMFAAKNLAEARALGDEVIRTETLAITDDINKFQRNTQDILEPAFDMSNFKAGAKRVLEAEPTIVTPEITARLTSSIDDIETRLTGIISEKKSLFGAVSPEQLGKIPKALEAIRSLKKRMYTPTEGSYLARIVDPAQQAEVYSDIMEVRRYVGHVTAPKERGRGTAAQRALMPSYAALKSIELDSRIWPKALVQMRDETHAAFTEMIPASTPIQGLWGTVKDEVGKVAGPGRWQRFRQLSAPKIKGYLLGTGDPVNFQKDEAVAMGLIRQVEWAETLAKWFPTDDTTRAAVAENRAYAENILHGIRDVKLFHATLERYDVEAAKAKNLGAVMGVLESAFLGLPMGVGNITSGILRSIRWSTRDMTKVAGVAAAGEAKVDGFVTKAFKNVLSGTVEAARHGMTAAAITRAMTEAEAMQDPASPQRQALSQQVNGLRDGDGDELAMAVEEAAMRRHNFILSKVSGTDETDPLMPGKPATVSPAKQASDARYIEAAYDPMGAFKRMAEGTSSREDLETMKAVFPAIYQNFAERLLAKAATSKVPLDIRQRQRLHRITSMPTSASHDPGRFIKLQEVAITMKQPKDPKGPAPQASKAGKMDIDGLMSRSDELMAGGDD